MPKNTNKSDSLRAKKLLTLSHHSFDAEPNIHRRMNNSNKKMHAIGTELDGSLVNDGIMFDIRSSPTEKITIHSITFATGEKGPCDVEIYTKKGSHKYFEEERSAWTRVVNTSTECMGPGLETIITQAMVEDNASPIAGSGMENMVVENGLIRAFYIRVSGADIVYSTGETANEVYVEDSHVQILEGTGLDAFFQGFKAPRRWNGSLIYSSESTSSTMFDGACSRLVQLDTISQSPSNSFGVMFNARSKSLSDLTIQGMIIYSDTFDEIVEYEVYSIMGGFEFGKESLIQWGAPVAKGAGRSDTSSRITITQKEFEGVDIKPSETHGFYVTLKTKNLLYHTTLLSVGSTFGQTDDLVVTVGTGVGSYPLGNDFYNNRGFYGRIIYTSNESCDLDTTVSYHFVIHYPNDWSTKELIDEIEFGVNTTIPDLLKTDDNLNLIQQTHGLGYLSVKSYEDNGGLGSCDTTKIEHRCVRMTTNVTLSHEDGADAGTIEFSLLEHRTTVTEALNVGGLKAFYSGDEPLNTRMIVTLAGVPKKRMGVTEVEIFERSTRDYLKKNADSDDVEVLSVQVKGQILDGDDTFKATNVTQETKIIEHDVRRLQDEDTSSIEITTIVTGKHRPPSPGLDFDTLIEDSINSDDNDFKEELIQSTSESGIEYFSNVQEIRARSALTHAPTQAPGLDYTKADVNEKDLGLVANIGIIVGAAIFTFALVFGAFIYQKRRQEKSKFKLTNLDIDDEDDDDEDPLFFDLFKKKQKGNAEASKRALLKDSSFRDKHLADDDGPSRGIQTQSCEDGDNSLSRFSSRHRSTQEVVVDMNGEGYFGGSKLPPTESKNKSRSFRWKSKSSGSRSTVSKSSKSATQSQYDQLKTQSSHRRHSRASNHRNRRSSNDSSIASGASRPEYEKFKEANGYYPPARRSSNAFVNIDLNNSGSNDDDRDHVDQSRRSFVDQHCDASSVMSSSTSSSLSSSGNLPEKPLNHRLDVNAY